MDNKEESVVKEALMPFGKMLAEEMAAELEVKGGLLQPKGAYIEQRAEEIVDKIQSEMKKKQENLARATQILHERLSQLSAVERKGIEQEMGRAADLMKDLLVDGKPDMKPTDTFQSLLHLSNETLLWIYKIGHDCSQKEEKQDAVALFQLLTVLNPLVADYWVAYGICLRAIHQEMEALYAFSIATFMNPEQPSARYNAAEIFLDQKQTQEATAELEALEKIIQIHGRADLQPAAQQLKQKIQLSKAS